MSSYHWQPELSPYNVSWSFGGSNGLIIRQAARHIDDHKLLIDGILAGVHPLGSEIIKRPSK